MPSRMQIRILRLAYKRKVTYDEILNALRMNSDQLDDLYQIMLGNFETKYLITDRPEGREPAFICNEYGKEIVEKYNQRLWSGVVGFALGAASTVAAQLIWHFIKLLLLRYRI